MGKKYSKGIGGVAFGRDFGAIHGEVLPQNGVWDVSRGQPRKAVRGKKAVPVKPPFPIKRQGVIEQILVPEVEQALTGKRRLTFRATGYTECYKKGDAREYGPLRFQIL